MEISNCITIVCMQQQNPKGWSVLLQNPDNKIELVKFLTRDWLQHHLSLCSLYVYFIQF